MSAMELNLRAALIGWLATDPLLSQSINSIGEEAPSRTSLPWLAIAASASADWSSKTHEGREIRVALELHGRGDQPGSDAALIENVETRIAEMPADQGSFAIVTRQFMRSRAEQRGDGGHTTLLEYRFRVLST
jgi:hypothetical protein